MEHHKLKFALDDLIDENIEMKADAKFYLRVLFKPF